MKIIGITHGYMGSVSGALVEMTGDELNILIGMRRRDADVKVGDKLNLKDSVQKYDELRRQFRDLASTSNHLRKVAEKMDEFQLPKWSDK